MNRYQKIVCVSIALAPALALAQSTQTVIYKSVDEGGRVTYANSPIKGGVRVELEPLTVIPSTPSGSLTQSSARAPFVMHAVEAKPTMFAGLESVTSINITPISQPAAVTAAPVNVALAVTAPNPIEIKPPKIDTEAFEAQRRTEARKHNLESDYQTEEQLLLAAKAQLDEEQKNSGRVRALRASFSPTAAGVTSQKPLLAPETRAEIERHFERVRNLQDQVAMHENNLQGLREKISSLQ